MYIDFSFVVDQIGLDRITSMASICLLLLSSLNMLLHDNEGSVNADESR